MLTLLTTFFGSAGLRLFISWFTKFADRWQEHKQEVQLLQLQMKLAERRAELQLDIEEFRAGAEISIAELKAFMEAQRSMQAMTGIKWIDGVRMMVRPTIAIAVLTVYAGMKWSAPELTDFDEALIGSVFGFYFADRALSKMARSDMHGPSL